MKKLLLLTSFLVVLFGCKKEIEKTTATTPKFAVQNDAVILEERYLETNEDLLLTNGNPMRGDLAWLHVAKIAAPEHNGAAMEVVDVSYSGDLAYVAYKAKDAKKSVLDLIDLSDADYPYLVSSISFDGIALNAVAGDAQYAYAAGIDGSGNTILHKVKMEELSFSTNVVENQLGETVVSYLVFNEGQLSLSQGEAQFLLDQQSLKLSDKVSDATDAFVANEKAIYNGYTLSASTAGLNFQKGTKSVEDKGAYAVPTTKVVGTEFYVLAAEFSAISFIQGMSNEDLKRCKKKKKKKSKCKDRRRCGRDCKKDCRRGGDDDDDDGDRDDDDDDDDNNQDFGNCQCEGKMKELTFTYNGESGRDIFFTSFRDNDIIDEVRNAQNGETYTVEGDDHRGRFDAKTIVWFSRRDQHEIHTSCSEDILGDTYGAIEITGYVDGEGSACSVDGEDDNNGNDNGDDNGDDNGGDVGNQYGDCQCEGRMQSLSLLYTGETGRTFYVKTWRDHRLMATISNAVNGETYTIAGDDRHGRFESQTKIWFNRNEFYRVHTSCSEDILGAEFGDVTVVGYTDGQGSACELDIPDPEPVETFTECQVVGADPGYAFFQAVWLGSLVEDATNGNLLDRGFRFEGGFGEFRELPNGKAILTGEIYSPNYPENRWAMTCYFSGKSTWEEWSAMGRDFKRGNGYVDGAHEDWTYYIVDPNEESVMVGMGDNAGHTSIITHRPASYLYGFQIGSGGANDKNSAEGMAGWFSYTKANGTVEKGDWNVDILNCTEN